MRMMDTLFIGQHLVELPAVASTNTYLRELLQKSKPTEGIVVNAHHQEEGRGQRGNTWLSEAGKNLTFSTLLYPSFLLAEQQFLLSKVTSLAVLDFLKEILPTIQEVKVKWPNDVYVGDEKIGGILVENTLVASSIDSSIVGIGLNVNQIDFPQMLLATSVRKLIGSDIDLETSLSRLCSLLEARYLQLKRNQIASIDDDYLTSLYRFGQAKFYKFNGVNIQAKIIGVSPLGRLVLLLQDGKNIECDFKEIVFLP